MTPHSDGGVAATRRGQHEQEAPIPVGHVAPAGTNSVSDGGGEIPVPPMLDWQHAQQVVRSRQETLRGSLASGGPHSSFPADGERFVLFEAKEKRSACFLPEEPDFRNAWEPARPDVLRAELIQRGRPCSKAHPTRSSSRPPWKPSR
jgi:hypothetical protein